MPCGTTRSGEPYSRRKRRGAKARGALRHSRGITLRGNVRTLESRLRGWGEGGPLRDGCSDRAGTLDHRGLLAFGATGSTRGTRQSILHSDDGTRWAAEQGVNCRLREAGGKRIQGAWREPVQWRDSASHTQPLGECVPRVSLRLTRDGSSPGLTRTINGRIPTSGIRGLRGWGWKRCPPGRAQLR